MTTKTLKVVSSIVNNTLWLILLLPSLLIYRLVTPPHTGFFCNDESLKLPFKENTIPTTGLIIIALGIPAIIIFVTETVICITSSRENNENNKNNCKTSCCHLLRSWVNQLGRLYSGGSATLMFTFIIKYSAGRLRPNFFAACKPNISLLNCSADYMENYFCTNPNKEMFHEVSMSFPSGHASLSMYSMLAVAIYLHYRVYLKWFQCLIPLLQATLLSVALYCSFTRVADNKHHLSDVLVGDLLGVCITIIYTFCNDKLPKMNRNIMKDHKMIPI